MDRFNDPESNREHKKVFKVSEKIQDFSKLKIMMHIKCGRSGFFIHFTYLYHSMLIYTIKKQFLLILHCRVH